jgi:glyoxylase-like metal-dependent hydrolase (beta-lactamase superfamily II)
MWSPTPIDASLSFWLAPHPGWTPASDKPDGWPEQVASAAVDVAGAPLVLIDPIAPSATRDPAAASGFWTWLDERQRARGGVAILLSNHFHGRHAPDVLARYPGTPVYAAAVTSGRATVAVTHAVADGDRVSGGVVARTIDGLDDGELAWHIPAARALFFADTVLGTGTGLRLAPPTWTKDASLYESVFVPSMRRLVALEAEHVIPSHGAFELGGGVAKLKAALDAA